MKKYLIPLLICIFCITFANAQSTHVGCSPLNDVPEWVKQSVSPEEYEAWETLSSMFYIDYSFLKYPLSEKRKEEIRSFIYDMAEKIKNGSYNQKGAELTFANEEVIPVEDWPTEIIKKKNGTIYSSINGYDLHVLLTLWYKRNEQTGNLHILQHTVTINAAEQLKIDKNDLPKVTFFNDDNAEILKGCCSGTLVFTDTEKRVHEESFSSYFSIK